MKEDTHSSILSPQNLQAILDTTVDSIVTINEGGIVLAFNKASERMFGYQKEEVIGNNVTLLMPEPYSSEHDAYMQDYIRTGRKKIIGIGREAVAKRKDGSVFPVDLAVGEVFIGSTRLFTGIICDITARKKSDVIEKENIYLDAELKAKGEYVSMLSHELRTPITSVCGTLELLAAEENLADKVRELITIAHRNSKRLVTLINQTLDIEKIRSGRTIFEKRPFLVDLIVQEAMIAVQEIARSLDVQLVNATPSSGVQIFSDSSRVVQVLINLIHNAVKFSPAQGVVTLSIQVMGEKLRICVQDEGRGIPEEFQKEIFSPFLQIPNNNSRIAGGTGLGLYICKTMIEQLEGSIGFTSRLGEGTTFYLEFPLYIV